MKRLLFTLLAVWTLVLGPGLCVLGAWEHSCLDCPTGDTCAHEEDCAEDPCVEDLLSLSQAADQTVPLPLVIDFAEFILTEPDFPTPVAWPRSDSRPRLNLPMPPSDLPLII